MANMKILTVRQPWASLIVAGIKDVENRSWRTTYRGRLGIHAAMRFDQDALDAYGHLLDDDLPLGALVGSVTLTDCITDSRSEWAEPGQWHWILTDAKKRVRPKPMTERLGLWQA
jgi:hypothetical protein